jgi:signal transduction histidine kinase
MLAKHKSIEYLCMAVEEIRKLSKELVVPQLQGEGLVNSIQALVSDIQLSNVIKIRFTHDAENELLGTGIKVTLFRIVQEQLKNILKHSGANLVDIYLENKGGESKLVIRDNGTGFDPRQTTRGIGLSSIHERTRFYNGRVKLETSPGNGCTLTITIPSEGKK